MTSLPRQADVVVVGGGVIGTSIAFHLAEAGTSTSASSSGTSSPPVRPVARREVSARSSPTRSTSRSDCAASKRSTRFEERPGAEIDLHQVGYLFLLDRQEDVAAFEESVALQNELGVPSRFVALDEVHRLCPLAGLDGVIGAAFCALDGHASPEAVVQGYAAGARRHGATVATRAPVTGVEVRDGVVEAVTHEVGRIETNVVICAAGVWSPEIAGPLGIELPVRPYLREVGFTGPVDDLPERMPLTVDFSSGLYFHREGPGLLFGMADREQPPGFERSTDGSWLEKVMEVAERRLPSLLDMGLAGGWKGYYEVTPDHNALVGEARSVARFLYATGFSGHGFLQAPAVGEIVRDLVLGREPFVELAPLAAERFESGTPRPERNVI